MTSATRKQIRVSLDTRIPLEAMVCQRLHRLPRTRQNEWLRQLLLAGFRSECQVIKSASTLPVPVTHRDQLNRASARNVNPGAGTADQKATKAVADTSMRSPGNEPSSSARTHNTNKTFPHLRRVMGE